MSMVAPAKCLVDSYCRSPAIKDAGQCVTVHFRHGMSLIHLAAIK